MLLFAVLGMGYLGESSACGCSTVPSDNRYKLIARLRAWDQRLSEGAWRHSIIRRAVILLFLIMPGVILNFLLLIVMAEIMGPKAFGLFYLGTSITVLLAAPAPILSLFMARHIASLSTEHGSETLWRAGFGIIRHALTVAIGFTAILGVGFAGFGLWTKIDAVWMIPLLIVNAATFYMVDIARGFLNGMHRFIMVGLTSTVWMVLRFVFCVIGALWIGKVWAAFVGLVLAGFSATVVFMVGLGQRRPADGGVATTLPVAGKEYRDLPAFSFGYGVSMVIAYADILVSYLVLDPQALGAYTASSVLPKGVFTVTLPIIQVMMATAAQSTSGRGYVTLRTLFLIFVLTGMGALVLNVGQDAACGGEPWRIGVCEPGLLSAMAISVIPISLLRCLVGMQLTAGRYWHASILLLPLGLFAYYCLTNVANSVELATAYVYFVFLTLAVYAPACFFVRNRP